MISLKQHKNIFIAMTLLFVMKSMLPIGVMPSFENGNGFSLEICMGNSKSISLEAQKIEAELAQLIGQDSKKHPNDKAGNSPCEFATHTGQQALSSDIKNINDKITLKTKYVSIDIEHIILRNIALSFSARAPPLFV